MRRKREKKGVTYRKGYRRVIMRILLTCGCLSKKGIHMLGDNTYVQYASKIKEMKEEGLIEEVRVLSQEEGYHKTLRLATIRPTDEKFMETFPSYAGHYYRYAVNNARSISFNKTKSAAIKAYRESEVVCMLSQTSVRIYPDEKVAIREEKPIPLYPPCFYNSLEIKEGGSFKLKIKDNDEKNEIVGSRIMGMIISEGGIYGVYHTEDKQIKWTRSAEGQISNAMSKIINERCVNISEEEREAIRKEKEEKTKVRNRTEYENLPVDKIPKVENAILIGSNSEIFAKTLKNDKPGKLNLYESGYEKFYALPYIKEGQQMLQVMVQKGWIEDLKQTYLKGMDTNTKNSSVSCDAIKDDKFILFFGIPDLIKLKKFINNAVYYGEPEKFVVYCFDFQEEFIEKIADENITIWTTSFNDYWENRGREE